MAAVDTIITKAGPGTIAEALISGLPILLNGNVPCQVWRSRPDAHAPQCLVATWLQLHISIPRVCYHRVGGSLQVVQW